MSNKTCGECKHLNRDLAFCRACGAKWLKENDGANCKYFEQKQPPTNGDKIRQMTNSQLSKFLARLAVCNVCFPDSPKGDRKYWYDWTFAPAESEGRDE